MKDDLVWRELEKHVASDMSVTKRSG